MISKTNPDSEDQLRDKNVVMPPMTTWEWVPSEEVNEIISSVPPWILRRGMTGVFTIVCLIVLFAAIIQYPDVIRTTLKVNSLNAPKSVLAKQSGKLTTILIHEGQFVNINQPLAYIESVADPNDVIKLATILKNYQADLQGANTLREALPTHLRLGELQIHYQPFYQMYLQYLSTKNNGYYQNKLSYLEKEIGDVNKLKKQIYAQKILQQREHDNQEQEYEAYKKLFKGKVISRSEFSQQENKYLSAKYPVQQSETALLNNDGILTSKEKEILELRHTIAEEQGEFVQSLNKCIAEIESWMALHVLRAPVKGKVSFAGIIEENQNLSAEQEVFVINPGNTDFFGEIQIPQYNMGKVKTGAQALVKLKSYPHEQFGMIRGKLVYISEVAFRDSVFVAKISFEKFENNNTGRKIILKNGMQAEAEIITEQSSVLSRLSRNIMKGINN